MKNNCGKKFLFILSSLWHCTVSFFSPWWLLLSFAGIFDVNNDEYSASLLVGGVLLFFWTLCFIPSFAYLTRTLKNHKKLLGLIPLATFILFSVVGMVIFGFPSAGEIISDIFGAVSI